MSSSPLKRGGGADARPPHAPATTWFTRQVSASRDSPHITYSAKRSCEQSRHTVPSRNQSARHANGKSSLSRPRSETGGRTGRLLGTAAVLNSSFSCWTSSLVCSATAFQTLLWCSHALPSLPARLSLSARLSPPAHHCHVPTDGRRHHQGFPF